MQSEEELKMERMHIINTYYKLVLRSSHSDYLSQIPQNFSFTSLDL